jgi:hypothetical protein
VHPKPKRSQRVVGVPVEVGRPLETKQALRGFQDGKTGRQIAQETGISVNTLTRLKKDHHNIIQEKQEKALDDMLDVRSLALTRLKREIDDVPLPSLCVVVGILSDKITDQTGGTTSTVQHVSVKLPQDVQEGTVIDLLPSDDCGLPGEPAKAPVDTDKGNCHGKSSADALDGAGGVTDVSAPPSLTHTNRDNFFPKVTAGDGGKQGLKEQGLKEQDTLNNEDEPGKAMKRRKGYVPTRAIVRQEPSSPRVQEESESAIESKQAPGKSTVTPGEEGWEIVSFAGDCGIENEETGELGENCSVCGGLYEECPCPGPTQEGYEYQEFSGVMYARLETTENETPKI